MQSDLQNENLSEVILLLQMSGLIKSPYPDLYFTVCWAESQIQLHLFPKGSVIHFTSMSSQTHM